jgi:type II secretory pathway component PulJ
MKPLTIVWTRLLKDGRTCVRCGGTEQELERAMAQLEPALRPLGFVPVLETRAIDEAAFRADSSQSNQVWIAGRPLEAWLGARVGASPCCSVCGELPCRTVEAGGTTYETVPSELIVRAALLAASQPTQVTPASDCC